MIIYIKANNKKPTRNQQATTSNQQATTSKQQETNKQQQATNKQPTSNQQATNKQPKMSSSSMTTKRNNGLSKLELYKKVKMEKEVFIEWLDEIKKNGIDNKKRVRNPLREGGYIYTDKNGLYATLWNICVFTFQGNYDFNGIPRPTKIVYKHPRKYWNL